MTNRSSLRARSGVLIAALVIALGACKGEDKAAAPATRMPRECATEGCENLGLVRFERGGVESHYCPDCYGLLTLYGNTPTDE